MLIEWLRLILLLTLTGVATGCGAARRPGPRDDLEARRLIDQGSVHLIMGDIERARVAFEVAYELTGSAAALDGLGCIAFAKGDLGRAESFFIRAYEMDKNYLNSIANLALLYELQGSRREAELLYRRAMAEMPADYRVRNNYAGFLMESGGERRLASQAALEELLKARALADHPLIVENIMRLRREDGERKESAEAR